jgi:hypothetical protein
VDVSTVSPWVVPFSSGDSGLRVRIRFGRHCAAVSSRNEERLDQLIAPIGGSRRRSCVRAECRIQCVGNYVENVGLSQICVTWVPQIADTGT